MLFWVDIFHLRPYTYSNGTTKCFREATHFNSSSSPYAAKIRGSHCRATSCAVEETPTGSFWSWERQRDSKIPGGKHSCDFFYSLWNTIRVTTNTLTHVLDISWNNLVVDLERMNEMNEFNFSCTFTWCKGSLLTRGLVVRERPMFSSLSECAFCFDFESVCRSLRASAAVARDSGLSWRRAHTMVAACWGSGFLGW